MANDMPAANKSNLSLTCPCGMNHIMTLRAAGVILQGFINGDVQRVTARGVETDCLVDIADALDCRTHRGRVLVG